MSTTLNLREWRTYSPEDTPSLRGLGLDGPHAREDADRLTRAGRLRISELRAGLQVETFAWVGQVRLGSLQLTLAPKLHGLPLVQLLRYAYGLRDLELHAPARYFTGPISLDDLLIRQLLAEGEELISRGLRRRYVERRSDLGAPQGRIDLTILARRGGLNEASLPCVHHPMSEDQPLNRILRAGLHLAARAPLDPELAGALRSLAKRMDAVTPIPLTGFSLEAARRGMSRLDRAYEAAISLIELLHQSLGPTLGEDDGDTTQLPGLLFDMNRFFQRLLGRFLREHLEGYTVVEEYDLRGMLRYRAEANPRRRRAPLPRPDFAIVAGGRVVQLLDAKYRDLWANELPTQMLYQLALYATNQGEGGEATILYPTLATGATEAQLDILDPIGGGRRASVNLRPVRMMELAGLLGDSSTMGSRRRGEMALEMVFGPTSAARHHGRSAGSG